MAIRGNPLWPVVQAYAADALERISLPLGGIGTGTISLGGRGDLHDWEIVNRPAKGFTPDRTFFALWAKPAGGPAVTRCLESQIHSRLDGHSGSAVRNACLPRFAQGTFLGSYPMSQVLLADLAVPVDVRLEAFNPFVPGDADASGLPVAVLRYVLSNKTNRPVQVGVCGSMENFIGFDGKQGKSDHNVNEFRRGAGKSGRSGVFFRSAGVDASAEQYGTLALTTTAGRGVSYRTSWAQAHWGNALIDFWDDFSADGALDEREALVADPNKPASNAPIGSLAVKFTLAPKAQQAVTFLITWHFPNRQTWTPKKLSPADTTPAPAPSASCGCAGGACANPDLVGNYYTTRFTDAWDAAVQIAPELPSLEQRTLGFARALCDSDIPQPIQEAALFNLTGLRSQTSFRTADGRFFAWEGCDDNKGCCHGTCTHVWNYEYATDFLFGALARDFRRTMFGPATGDDGHMSFRVGLPLERARDFNLAAADGQMGMIVHVYQQWKLSADDAFLKGLWPKVKKAMEFCWIPKGWDADQDGVMEGCQHNTMDVEYYGPNPQISVMYLAALRAEEEMARFVGDDAFAARCRDLRDKGGRAIDEQLFNGEFYFQKIVPPTGPDAIAPGLRHENMGARDVTKPDLQIGPGCEINMLLGQFQADLAGLGDLLDPAHIRTALKSMVKYNFLPSLAGHFNNLRTYAMNDEAGVVMATWPRGGRPAFPTPYALEVWTGLEYMLAAHLICRGMTGDALKIVQAVRSRHDGRKRSPYNEPECGHHYARAMSSWALVPAWTGFGFDGQSGTMTFAAPRGKVNWFWSTGDAFGTVKIGLPKGTRDRNVPVELTVIEGKITVAALALRGFGTGQLPVPIDLAPGETIDLRIPKD